MTTGDKIVDRPLADIGGKGLFLKEIEEKLLEGAADIAVHSMKDVPPDVHPDLLLACVPEREDPRDVLVSTRGETLANLKQGATLGTSSLRRGVQLKLLRPDLRIVPIRGNVETRIRKCREGEVDATILAQAGINRLALHHEVAETLSADISLPAVGQGALVIEIRKDALDLKELLLTMQHHETAVITSAERGVMSAVEGDCKTPVAAFGERVGETLRLRAILAEPDGSRFRKEEVTAAFPTSQSAAFDLGRILGQRLKSA